MKKIYLEWLPGFGLPRLKHLYLVLRDEPTSPADESSFNWLMTGDLLRGGPVDKQVIIPASRFSKGFALRGTEFGPLANSGDAYSNPPNATAEDTIKEIARHGRLSSPLSIDAAKWTVISRLG
jgi:hypothetical protein